MSLPISVFSSLGLKDVHLEVTVCNWDRVAKHAPVGAICFSLDGSSSINGDTKRDTEKSAGTNKEDQKNMGEGLSQQHFLEASLNPRKAIAKWHTL